jgi:exopolysaccharide biosynthesis protein
MPASAVRFTLEIARRDNVMVPWSLADAPPEASIAFNAGQFTDAGPWGWIVHKQKELQPPGVGPLAGAFAADSAGMAEVLSAEEMRAWRTTGRAVEALQSYPMLLVGEARPPAALCDAQAGVDLLHRDARLAIGVTRDVSGTRDVLVVMSRYEMPGGTATRVPIGPTTPEMAEIMRRLGADRALMLDGGLSAQMLVRTARDTSRWPGLRAVPLGLAARLRR